MNDDDLLRYSRHLLLDDIGIDGQRRLLASHALIVGAGGLGSPVALYLGTAGVGRITIVDGDRVDLTNLQRQIAHVVARIGAPKAASAALAIGAAIGFDGQLSVYDTRSTTSPCYACAFPADAAVEDIACATMGVFAPLVGIVGSMQAAEALKILVGIGTPLVGRLQMLDARSMEWTEMRVDREPACPVCGPVRRSRSAA